MKKFLLGFIAGAIARHYTLPQLTSDEILEEFRTTVQRFHERLDEKEKAEKAPTPSTPPTPEEPMA